MRPRGGVWVVAQSQAPGAQAKRAGTRGPVVRGRCDACVHSHSRVEGRAPTATCGQAFLPSQRARSLNSFLVQKWIGKKSTQYNAGVSTRVCLRNKNSPRPGNRQTRPCSHAAEIPPTLRNRRVSICRDNLQAINSKQAACYHLRLSPPLCHSTAHAASHGKHAALHEEYFSLCMQRLNKLQSG